MKPPFYTVTACGAKLAKQICPHVETKRAAGGAHARSKVGQPGRHPEARHLSRREGPGNPPGGQRVPLTVVAPHPECPQHDVLHARPNAALTQPPEVQILMRQWAEAQLDRGLDRALSEGVPGTLGEAVDSPAPLGGRVDRLVKQRA